MAVGGLSIDAQTLQGVLTSKPQIHIPMYQRPYSWGKGQIDTLMDDIEAELHKAKKKDRTLFLGSIVFNVETTGGDETVDLIDGQQRLMTLSLIQSWWIQTLDEIQHNRAGATQHALRQLLFNDELDEDDPLPDGPLGRVLRVVPAHTDQATFESVIRRGKGPGPGRYRLVTAFRQIDERFRQAFDKLAKEQDVEGDLEDPAFAQIVVNYGSQVKDLLERRVTFGVIEVREPLNPFAVFESLNSKGLGLAASDLVKNYLLKQLPETLRPEALDQWDTMVETLPEDKIVDFLRAWYIATRGHVQRAALYESFRKLLNTKSAVQNSLRDWNYGAWWFLAFHKGKVHDDHPDFQGAAPTPELRAALRRWKHLSFKQGIPVLMALVSNGVVRYGNKDGQKLLARIMALLEAAYVRLFITANVRGSVFESRLNQLCEICRTETESAVTNVRTLLSAVCRDEGVDGELDWKNVQRSVAESRYLLYRIAEHQAGEAIQLLGPDKWHVEHILPQTKPGGHENALDAAAYESTVAKIGNLTLLLGSDNSSLKNAPYAKKKGVFQLYDGKSFVDHDEDPKTPELARPALPMNSDIPLVWKVDWNADTIAERGAKLGSYAAIVWSL